MSLPEATIIIIIQTFYALRNNGISEKEALNIIESHRASIGCGGEEQNYIGLNTFIKYRLTVEHSHGTGLENDYIDKVMIEAIKLFA